MKINTELLNILIDEASVQSNLIAKKNTILEERELLKERLIKYIYYFLFIVAIFIVIMILFKIFYPKSLHKTTSDKIVYVKDCKKQHDNLFNAKVNNKLHKAYKAEKITNSNNQIKSKPFSGIDYVKQNHFIYKRIWEEGILVEQKRLKTTIEDSRKLEKIPQFAKEIKKK